MHGRRCAAARGRMPDVPDAGGGRGVEETTGVECALPDIAGCTVDELRALPGSVLAVALERLQTEAAQSHDDEYTSWQASA